MILTELRKLAEAATPGPYKHATNWRCPSALKGAFIDAQGPVPARIADILAHGGVGTQKACDANAAYIAALYPERILALLDCVVAADRVVADDSMGKDWDAYDAARKRLEELK